MRSVVDIDPYIDPYIDPWLISTRGRGVCFSLPLSAYAFLVGPRRDTQLTPSMNKYLPFDMK